MECGIKHGQKKKTREIITWAKRRKLIKREELLAFLLDQPYIDSSAEKPESDISDCTVTHSRQGLQTSCGGAIGPYVPIPLSK